MNKTQNAATNEPPPGQSKPVAQAKRYSEAFQQEAVANWIKTGQSGAQIAAELGLSYPSLKAWKRRYWGDATPQRVDLETENRALKAEWARVREPRDLLKNGGHFQRTVEARSQTVDRMNADHELASRCAADLALLFWGLELVAAGTERGGSGRVESAPSGDPGGSFARQPARQGVRLRAVPRGVGSQKLAAHRG